MVAVVWVMALAALRGIMEASLVSSLLAPAVVAGMVLRMTER